MNFLLNGLDDSRVIGMAMSDAKGFIHFTNDTNVTAMNKITNDETNSISVPVTTLDEWTKEMNLEANTNFIVKIDVEGFEASVLRGGADFFANADVRGLVIEIFDEHKSVVDGLLAEYGYNIQNINGANYLAQKGQNVRNRV